MVIIVMSSIFGIQGALDGGLDISHGDKRFVGYDTEAKKLDPEQLKKYIMGGHVSCPVKTTLSASCCMLMLCKHHHGRAMYAV